MTPIIKQIENFHSFVVENPQKPKIHSREELNEVSNHKIDQVVFAGTF